MADYTFLEYTYNPDCETTTVDVMHQRLKSLGFSCKATHDSNLHELWTQRQIILCVRKSDVLLPGLSGVGFNFSQSELDSRCMGVNFDPESDMYIGSDSQGLRILGMPDEISLAEYNYTKPDDVKDTKQNGIENVTGLVYNTLNAIQEEWKEMGFKFNNSERNSIISSNNRLGVMFKNSIHEQKIPTIVVDTHDVFNTTVNLLCAGIDTLQVPVEEELNFGQELNFKIRAYNCVALGNGNSYSIEKYIPNALPGLNIIARMRKRYMNLPEYSLDRFYANDI